jgi:hypothetical protein
MICYDVVSPTQRFLNTRAVITDNRFQRYKANIFTSEIRSRCNTLLLLGATAGHVILLLQLLLRSWHQAVRQPNINQGLHGLNFLVAQKPKQFTDVDEVDEARVELLVRVHVPEGLQPVAVVDMCITPHHLAVDALNIGLESLGEAGLLAEPVTTRELGKWRVETRGTERLRLASEPEA